MGPFTREGDKVRLFLSIVGFEPGSALFPMPPPQPKIYPNIKRFDFVQCYKLLFRIILLFDANKLDISDEFRRSIEAIHGYEDKVRIILNKADQVDHQVDNEFSLRSLSVLQCWVHFVTVNVT